MTAYENNTGKKHPLAGGIKRLDTRDTGSEPLTDDNALLWYGPISIGTQGDSFTGMAFLYAFKFRRQTLFSGLRYWEQRSLRALLKL
jgi:hypothetical protein